MPSPSQIRRNGSPAPSAPPAPPAPPAGGGGDDAAPFDLSAFLRAVEGATWEPPTVEKAERRKNGSNERPLHWSAGIIKASEVLDPVFHLPYHRPRSTPAGFTPDVASAPRDLTTLGDKIQRYAKRNAGSSLFLSDLIYGQFNTAGGIIPIPSLVDGQGLPLIALLSILPLTGEMYRETKYLRSLHGTNSLLQTIADRTARYCYIDDRENIRISDVIV